MRDLNIQRIMTTDPVTIGPNEPIAAARRLLNSHALNHLPVVLDGKLEGILSSSDMLKVCLLDENAAVLDLLLVRRFMQVNPVVLAPDTNLRDAAVKLSSGDFHALPVIEADRTLVGIVTSTDLIRHLLQQIPSNDSSIRTQRLSNGAKTPGDIDVMAAIHEVEQSKADGGELSDLERALLILHGRNRQLGAVFEAAERYVRGGHADNEHTVLLKRLAAVWDSAPELDL